MMKMSNLTKHAQYTSKALQHSIRSISSSDSLFINSTSSQLSSRKPDLGQLSSHDIVGPPSPTSNLRPVEYAPLFSTSTIFPEASASATPSSGSRSSHPYSLNEFNTQSTPLPPSLTELRNKLHLEDLEWITFRKRIDKMNETFWAHQSTDFETLEEAEKQRVLLLASIESSGLGSPSSADQQQLISSALDKFYKSWLLNEQARFKAYNLTWWKAQPELLRGSWRAQKRVWRWKLACWLHTWRFFQP
ncbi:uncharacterized protein MELLADRAFT_74340 [Melampsora larici-populina 98AG31]|uniref:Uncharacterized protein n=1 Tax=Melampsora larici-populina (strain 98AG31 / pathotype 3-4-7) TaxID=747676 RepID=F4RD37_MELLP|nr:uncharacterized protein MELLADRAFT_74340 [Melampsora larici-populina 98AG31]EGG09829.1 hypothetical protein MELLADRAFT_74340 [Melampsora larici-populina 98AG31]